ncbi:MAG TPA: YlcI/YnfO family protein [Actinotalea sp.]|nr:YlcI/YnfO family protein [Actinotalea sp.]
MSTQITVRIADDLVAAVDALVAAGRTRSRASIVERALERELRRTLAEQDASILAGTGADPDLDGLADWAAGRTVEPLG